MITQVKTVGVRDGAVGEFPLRNFQFAVDCEPDFIVGKSAMLTNIRMDQETFNNFIQREKISSDVKLESPMAMQPDILWVKEKELKMHRTTQSEFKLSSQFDRGHQPLVNSINFFLPLEGSPTYSLPHQPINSNKDIYPFGQPSPYLLQGSHHTICPPLWSLFNLYTNWCSNRHLEELQWRKEKHFKNIGELSESFCSGTQECQDESVSSSNHTNRKSRLGKSVAHHGDCKQSATKTKVFDDDRRKSSTHSVWNGEGFPDIRNESQKNEEGRRDKAKPVNWMLPDEEKDIKSRQTEKPSNPYSSQTTFNSAPLAFTTSISSSFRSESDFDSMSKSLLFQFPRNPFTHHPMMNHSYSSISGAKVPTSLFGSPSIRPEFPNYFLPATDDQLNRSPKDVTNSYSSGESTREESVDSSHRQKLKSNSVKMEPPPRFQCDACQKIYSTFNGLTKHKEFHCSTYVKKQFLCPHCECKSYASLGALKMHIRTHTLPCKCKLCGKAFSRPWLLQGHLRTHTGERPFECSHCSRAFADRSNLRAHLQTHCEVKRYNCQTCQKSFSRMSLLIKHRESQACSS